MNLRRLVWVIAWSLLPIAAVTDCAHVDPLVMSGESLDVTEKVFRATQTGIAAAASAQLLPIGRVHDWNTFVLKYNVLYPAAVSLWRNAKASQNQPAQDRAASLLKELIDELNTFIVSPDGGVI